MPGRKIYNGHLGPLKPSDYFREQADWARRFADNADTPQGKRAWTNIARHWQRLAQAAKTPPRNAPAAADQPLAMTPIRAQKAAREKA